MRCVREATTMVYPPALGLRSWEDVCCGPVEGVEDEASDSVVERVAASVSELSASDPVAEEPDAVSAPVGVESAPDSEL
jgi:hypothetical protein